MSDINNQRIDEMVGDILNMFTDEEHDTIMTTLVSALTLYVSTLCPECRKNNMRDLRKHIPEMLAEANKIAALNPGKVHTH